jgi:hypothetical protein
MTILFYLPPRAVLGSFRWRAPARELYGMAMEEARQAIEAVVNISLQASPKLSEPWRPSD